MARIVVTIIFGGFGLFMLYMGVSQYLQQRRLMRNAAPVEALVVKSEVFSSDPGRGSRAKDATVTHRPEVKFTYELGGKPYESDRLFPTIIVRGYASREAAAAELVEFPVGARVTAQADPAQPDKAFLIAQAGAGPVVFMIIGLLLPPVAWF